MSSCLAAPCLILSCQQIVQVPTVQVVGDQTHRVEERDDAVKDPWGDDEGEPIHVRRCAPQGCW